MPRIAGIDGCRGGWIVYNARGKSLDALHLELIVCESFRAVIGATQDADWVALDLPIGLLDSRRRGGRHCDQEARKRLSPRGSTVFSPPTRPLLAHTDYAELRAAHPDHGVSIQAFGIFPKLREVDALMTPPLQERIHECHPELAFLRLKGAPLPSKHSREGLAERRHLLENVSPNFGKALDLGLMRYPRKLMKRDDLLDALALVVTACQGYNGMAVRLPEEPERDAKGLRMEIWY